MFSSTKSSRPGRRLRRQQRDVVLAQDARAEVAQQEARPAGWPGSGWPAPRSWPRGRRSRCSSAEEGLLEALDQRAEGDRVGARPAGPIDHRVALHDARQRPRPGAPRAAARCGPWPRRRPARWRPQLGRVAGRPARWRRRRSAMRSTRGQSTRPGPGDALGTAAEVAGGDARPRRPRARPVRQVRIAARLRPRPASAAACRVARDRSCRRPRRRRPASTAREELAEEPLGRAPERAHRRRS